MKHYTLIKKGPSIDMHTILSTFATLGDTVNIFVKRFLHCTTTRLVHIKVLTSQTENHRAFPATCVHAISVFTKNMYSMFIECDFPIGFALVILQHLGHVDTVIQCDLQHFSPYLQGYMNVCTVPCVPPNRTETASGSSAAHDALQPGIHRVHER